MMRWAGLLLLAGVAAFLWLSWGSTPAPGEGAERLSTAVPAAPSEAATALGAAAGAAPRADLGHPARAVRGRIEGPGGQAVSGAHVVLYRALAPWPWRELVELESAFSDRDGRFRLATPRADDLMLEVVHQGHARYLEPAPPDVDELLVRLEHGFTIQGVVLTPDDEPAPDCLVMIEPGPWSARRAIGVRTDASGHFRFENVAAGEQAVARITARHEVWEPVTLTSVPVGAGENLRLQFRFSPTIGVGQRLEGVVVRAGRDERPIAGARVRLYPSTAWNGGLYIPYETATDDHGRFRFSGLPVGRLLAVVTHPDWSTAARVVSVGSDRLVKRFELVSRSVVSGKVLGVGAAGRELTLIQDHARTQTVVVEPDGSFRFPTPCSSGPALLEWTGGALAFTSSSARTASVTIEDGGPTELALEVTAPSILTGRVLDVEGRPLAGVRVATPREWLQRRHPEMWVTTTDADGVYRIAGLPPASVAQLLFDHDDHAVVGVTHSTGDPGETVEVPAVTLPRPGTIRGRVTRGGRPLPGASVFIGRGLQGATAVTGPDGGYELHNVAPGRYRVMARWSTLPIQVADGVAEVVSGGVIDAMDIGFPPGRRVRGVVYDEGGAPVAEALVFVAGAPGASSATDAAGRFEMEVPEGDVELQFYSPNFVTQTREVVPASVEQVVVRLPWVVTGSVEAVLLGLPGPRPLRAAVVRLTPLDLSATADENVRRQRHVVSAGVRTSAGRLRLERVPVGSSRLTIHVPGYAPFTHDIEVRSYRTTDLGTLRMEPGGTVHGIVRNAAGEPIAGAFVHIGLPEDFDHDVARHTQTDAQGRFTVTGAAPGAERLVVDADGYATGEVALRLPDDLLRDEPLEVVLQRNSAVEVQLVRDGAPAAELQLVALTRGGQLVTVEATDDDGRVRIEVPGAGTFGVALFGNESGQDKQLVEVDVQGEPRDYPVELELR